MVKLALTLTLLLPLVTGYFAIIRGRNYHEGAGTIAGVLAAWTVGGWAMWITGVVVYLLWIS
jgi:hypothetical protein